MQQAVAAATQAVVETAVRLSFHQYPQMAEEAVISPTHCSTTMAVQVVTAAAEAAKAAVRSEEVRMVEVTMCHTVAFTTPEAEAVVAAAAAVLPVATEAAVVAHIVAEAQCESMHPVE